MIYFNDFVWIHHFVVGRATESGDIDNTDPLKFVASTKEKLMAGLGERGALDGGRGRGNLIPRGALTIGRLRRCLGAGPSTINFR